jgi:hypothetical protein
MKKPFWKNKFHEKARRVTSPWSEEDVQKMIPIKPGLPQVGKPRI